MYQYHCLNNIAEVGLKKFDGNYAQTDKMSIIFLLENALSRESLYLIHREPMRMV